jgi:putative membrane protein
MIHNRGITHLQVLAALALLFGGPVAIAQQSSSSTTGTQHTSTKPATHFMTDAEFAQRAAEANLAEVKLGNLAEQQGTTQNIKDFGKRMVTDHSQAQENLKTAAASSKIELPATLDTKDQAVYDRLAKLSGEAFDRAYARDMVRDHRGDVIEFRHEANDGKDAAIKTFASKTLPTLETHLKLAHEMYHNVSAQGASESKSHSG